MQIPINLVSTLFDSQNHSLIYSMPKQIEAGAAISDAIQRLEAWLKTGACKAGKGHSQNHGNTHIYGTGYGGSFENAEITRKQFALVKQQWEAMLFLGQDKEVNYKTWVCQSSGSGAVGVGATTASETWDLCCKCIKCQQVEGFGGIKKPPTFVYHLGVIADPVEKSNFNVNAAVFQPRK
jgi:hypothetical protein